MSNSQKLNLQSKAKFKHDIPSNSNSSLPNSSFMTELAVHSGPLPSPEYFGGYECILPGAAERIMTLTEKEALHRHKLDERMLDCNEKSIRFTKF